MDGASGVSDLTYDATAPRRFRTMRRPVHAMLLLTLALTASAASAGPFRGLIFPAPIEPLDAAALPEGAAFVDVTTTDGLLLRGVASAPAEGRPVVLALPGNASSAADAFEWTSALRERGFGVMAVGYRGYSGNPGEPSTVGLVKDADAFLAALRERWPDRAVWIVGHSLGGAVGLDLASRSPPALVLTWGTFSRLRDMAPDFARGLLPDAFRNVDRARDVDAPWLLVHGLDDPIVPASHGEALHSAASNPVRRGASVVVMGMDHHVDPERLGRAADVGERFLERGSFDADGLPTDMKLIPFGQSVPLNP